MFKGRPRVNTASYIVIRVSCVRVELRACPGSCQFRPCISELRGQLLHTEVGVFSVRPRVGPREGNRVCLTPDTWADKIESFERAPKYDPYNKRKFWLMQLM